MSVLKIITSEKFEQLMDDTDPKAENIMLSILNGKEDKLCDGIKSNYSSLEHILYSPLKKMTGEGLSMFKILNNNFSPNFKVNYWF